ncbi:SRPBCC family protein [Aldersonia kunmingensis]|uniref:SRPBCC family protein n=1 Tax=Aldersonia kunmingensis TaxID=408066 RepID=UPI0008333EED|nr:SRPBCC family protein [Aldersonia kunmingensis]
MASPRTLEESRAISLPLADAYHGTIVFPLPELFRHRSGPIPPIKEIRDQDGEWGTVGQTRTILLQGGGSVREELTSVDAPNSFGYRLAEVKGPMSLLFTAVDGLWSFAPDGTGTNVSWQWTVHPRAAVPGFVISAFAHYWHDFAGKSLAELSTRLAV